MSLRGAAVIAAAAFVLVFGALPAGAAGTAPPAPKPRVGDIRVSNSSPQRGSEIDVVSAGWRPGGVVVIALSGTTLLRTTAGADGTVKAHVVIPDDAPQAFDLLSVTGTAASGVPQQIVTGVSVVVDQPAHSPARPWGVVFALAAAAAVLLLAGRHAERAAKTRRAAAG